MSKSIRIGSRTSKLAVAQAEIVAATLKAQFPDYNFEIVTKTTLGDNVQNKALYSFGGKSLWTSELEELLVSTGPESIDMIVHSLKDVPTTLPDEFKIGAVLDRADPRDVLVVRSDLAYKSLSELPPDSVIGTSSIRRTAQLRRRYPQFQFKVVRGNINTRLAKLEDPEQGYTCLILAAAGLLRIDLGYKITQYLSSPDVLYAVGQGALGIEIKKDDEFTRTLLDKIRDIPTTLVCTAERSLMRKLEGGCSVPLGVESTISPDGVLTIEACVISVDGTEAAISKLSRTVKTEDEAEMMGKDLAQGLLSQGAGAILEKINYDKLSQN
ncbi:porphobilinogen deaminase, dipyromethane cofactor binding domain-containing protein [Lipomyces chichibuensis]|uniref:porphobilinogen deaminase, dipyromethane cofactor binding domain-containing protein n=1 Tax=Lipomyces chichibuensis TaxID=1546026 RepID=UPI0033435F5C